MTMIPWKLPRYAVTLPESDIRLGYCAMTPPSPEAPLNAVKAGPDAAGATAAGRRRVAILVPPRFQSLDLTGPLEVFNYACALAPGAYDWPVRVVSGAGGEVESSSGLRIATEPLASLPAASLDTLMIAGGPGAHDPDAAVNADAVAWLAEQSGRIRRVASTCTGAFLLAAAGLLDGRPATTHWMFRDKLRRRFPRLKVEDDALFLGDGHIYTAAGVTAGIDLALALVEEDAGNAVALDIARRLVVYLRRPGSQAQFSAPLRAQARTASSRLDAVIVWIAENLDHPLTVEALAERAGMTPRTFARRFTDATGASPGRFVTQARVDEARRLLLDVPDLPLAMVAARVGLETAEGLRQLFQRALGISPEAYRRQFGVTREGQCPIARLG